MALLVGCGEEPQEASRQVQDRADALLDPIVEWCSGDDTKRRGNRADFESAVDPFAALALRHAGEIYPSFFSESQDVTFAELLRNWAKWCRWRGGAAARLEAAAHRL